MPGMTKADMEQVDQLIGAGNTAAARRLLQSLDDPRARVALEKFDKRYPDAQRPTLPLARTPPPPKPAPQFVRVPARPGDEMDEIKAAIRDKRYDDAEALLVLSDHPDAEKLRGRLGAIRGAGKAKPIYVQTEKDFTTKLTIASILIFFAFIPGVIAFEIFAAEAKNYPDAPGAKSLIRTRRNILFLTFLIFCAVVIVGILSSTGGYDGYGY